MDSFHSNFRSSLNETHVIKKFTYEYDFGDSWIHEVKIERAEELVKPLKLPQCIEGERNGPPEDCGGIWGYQNLVEAMKDPKHPEHRDLKEWFGGIYKPESFNLKKANSAIKSFLK